MQVLAGIGQAQGIAGPVARLPAEPSAMQAPTSRAGQQSKAAEAAEQQRPLAAGQKQTERGKLLRDVHMMLLVSRSSN